MLSILKIGFLFVGIWLTIVNFGRVYNKESVSSKQIIYQAIGITGFLVLQFNLL